MLVTTGMAIDAAAVLLDISAIKVVKAVKINKVPSPPVKSKVVISVASLLTAPV